ncbi:MAG: hypothetical protein SWQ30_12800 [Thermodesulfobacteriota bacterium]|nr:hypothetical protein [Thermodesulfobacteriota bacterium]
MKKSEKVQELLETIDLINTVSTQWPRGYSNARIRELLENGKAGFHEELFELLYKEEGKKKNAPRKKGNSKSEGAEIAG